MKVVACDTPVGTLHPAPLTSMPLASIVGTSTVTAFWADDDQYYLCASETPSDPSAARWFAMHSGVSVSEANDDERKQYARERAAALMTNIIPLGGGKVAFPIGSTGRRFYRVWRTNGSGTKGVTTKSRTRILEVRAARSRRQQA